MPESTRHRAYGPHPGTLQSSYVGELTGQCATKPASQSPSVSPVPRPSQRVTQYLDSTIPTAVITDQPESRLFQDRLARTGWCLVIIPDGDRPRHPEKSDRDIFIWFEYWSSTGLIKCVGKCSLLLYLVKKFIQDGC